MLTIDDAREGRVTANGLDLHYLELGEGELVVALHGFPDHARSFRHQMPALAEAGYRVVAPWLRGYAPSEIPPDGPWAMPVIAQDVLALIDTLGEQRAVLLGHDWGAPIAYASCALAPERVRKLVALSVPYGPAFLQSLLTDPEQQRRSWYMFFFLLPLAEQAVAHDDYAFIERLWADWSPGWSPEAAEMEAVKETCRQPGVLSAALGYYRHTLAPPPELLEVLGPLQSKLGGPVPVPALYLHGQDDGCIGVELSRGMEAYFSAGLERVVLEGCGHFLHQERPQEVNRHILAFLGED